ncbi:MAG: hypothetical protein P4L87_19510 [Formivibrio sp.]|nr:hypothetical protein [Formivibrio sp.]
MTEQFIRLPTFVIAVLLSAVALTGMQSNSYAGMFDSVETDNSVARLTVTLDEEHQIDVLAFSPDGKYLMAAPYYYSTTAHIWDWKNDKRLASPFQNKKVDPQIRNAIQYSSDGHAIAWCGYRTPIWKIDNAEELFVSEHEPKIGLCQAIEFFPDGKSVAIVLSSYPGDISTLAVRNASTGQLLWELSSKGFYPQSMAVSPDAQFIAIGGSFYDRDIGVKHEQIHIVDAERHVIVRTIEVVPSVTLASHVNTAGSIEQIAWSSDSIQIAAGLRGVPSDGADAVKIFDAASGALVTSEAGPMGTEVRGLCYTSDGKYLVELGIGKTVKIWDGKHTKLLQEISAKPAACAVSKDGHHLALGGGAPSLSNINPLLSLMFPGKGRILIYKFR